MYDTPGPAATGDPVACHLAMELIDDFALTCADAARVLTDRGYQCRSPDTARLWAIRGREEDARIRGDAMNTARVRAQQDRRTRAYLRELARNYHGGLMSAVEFVRESMRVEQRVAALHGTDAPKRVEMSGSFTAPMDAATAAQVAAPPPAGP